MDAVPIGDLTAQSRGGKGQLSRSWEDAYVAKRAQTVGKVGLALIPTAAVSQNLRSRSLPFTNLNVLHVQTCFLGFVVNINERTGRRAASLVLGTS